MVLSERGQQPLLITKGSVKALSVENAALELEENTHAKSLCLTARRNHQGLLLKDTGLPECPQMLTTGVVRFGFVSEAGISLVSDRRSNSLDWVLTNTHTKKAVRTAWRILSVV